MEDSGLSIVYHAFTSEPVRKTLEILYFLAGIALAATVFFAYSQFKTVKESFLFSKKAKAAEENQKFASEIIPKINEFEELKRTFRFPDARKKLKSYEASSIKDLTEEELAQFHQWMNAYFSHQDELKKEFFPITNAIEGLAAMVRNDLLDEEFIASMNSIVICEFVEGNYPIICWLRPTSDSPIFSEVLWLYSRCANRKEVLYDTKAKFDVFMEEVEKEK